MNDPCLVPCTIATEQAQLPIGIPSAMAHPDPVKKILACNIVTIGCRVVFQNNLSDLLHQTVINSFVRIDYQDPLKLEWDMDQRPVLMVCEIVELALNNRGPVRCRNLYRSVGAAGIVDDHLGKRLQAGKACFQVRFLVQSRDEDRNGDDRSPVIQGFL